VPITTPRAVCPANVCVASAGSAERSSFARPKSSTLTRLSFVTMTLAGLQVAMHGSFLMLAGQRRANLEDSADRESARGHQAVERLPLDQFHCEKVAVVRLLH